MSQRATSAILQESRGVPEINSILSLGRSRRKIEEQNLHNRASVVETHSTLQIDLRSAFDRGSDAGPGHTLNDRLAGDVDFAEEPLRSHSIER